MEIDRTARRAKRAAEDAEQAVKELESKQQRDAVILAKRLKAAEDRISMLEMELDQVKDELSALKPKSR